ncbi:MAG: lecithin retinol acyltransferase family protein [Planctomycetes bacterium]|nr:lecithin retinol acyltransferase family protein [Planctomycetota bacterium]
MARADLIYVLCNWGPITYRHFGIDMGDGSVVHLATVADSQTMQVHRVSWEEFSDGKEVRTESVRNSLESDDVVQRAEQAVGTAGYHLAIGNCEHFARACKTGESVSHQAGRVIGSALRTGIAGAIACSTKAAAYAATSATASGMTRVMVTRATGVSSLVGELARQGVYAASRSYSIEHCHADKLGKTAGTITAAIVGGVVAGPLGGASSAAIYLSIDHLTTKVWKRWEARSKPAEAPTPYRKSSG